MDSGGASPLLSSGNSFEEFVLTNTPHEIFYRVCYLYRSASNQSEKFFKKYLNLTATISFSFPLHAVGAFSIIWSSLTGN